jgi:hypothetical protein
MMNKSYAMCDLWTVPELGLRKQLELIQYELTSLRNKTDHLGVVIVPQIPAFAGIFLRGGQTISSETAKPFLYDIQEKWPDLLLFLEAGILIVKECNPPASNRLRFYRPDQDSLLVYTHELLRRITERSDTLTPPLRLLDYVKDAIALHQFDEFEFPLVAIPAQMSPIWSSAPQQE